MSRSSFQITIPEPCHEDWTRMQPDAKGKFCKACCHAVYDFSEKTPAEIRDILLHQSSGKICGYFKETQLDRRLSVMPDHRLMTVTRRFAIVVYLVFGSLLFSCKEVQEPAHKTDQKWQQDGPVFQKGRFRASAFSDDSVRRKYGGVDYIEYLTEEITDTVIMESQPTSSRVPVGK